MTTQRTTQRALSVGALVVLLAAAAALLLAAPARAATRVVILGPQGPSPQNITLAKGDSVRFQNDDGVTHTVTDAGTNWSFRKAIAAGASATTPAFPTAGTFSYTDDFVLVAVPQRAGGSIVVPSTAATASPSAAPKPSATTSPAPRPSAAPSPTAAPTASPTSTPATVGGAGTAVPPGFGPGVLPSTGPTPPASGPQPDLAPPVADSSASPAAVAPGATISYGDRNGVVQGSPHRYGLPAALAVVGITGIVSLLVRLLLAQPEARRRRTGPAVTLET